VWIVEVMQVTWINIRLNHPCWFLMEINLMFCHGGKLTKMYILFTCLSIQASTVASESAFSAGGRVLDLFRTKLEPENGRSTSLYQGLDCSM
jgi:hypothetical protein